LAQLIDILRGSITEAQLTNLTLRVLNWPTYQDSPDDWSMLRKVNDSMYTLAAKQEGPLLLKKLEVT
jgi:hypothetical protein